MKPAFGLFGFFALLLPACEPIEPAGTPGVFHEGGFSYCDLPHGICDVERPLPNRIAVSSVFWLQYSPAVDQATVLASSDDTRLSAVGTPTDSGEFRALQAGAVRAEAMNVSQHGLLDYVNLTLGNIDHIGVRSCSRAYNAITSPDGGFDPASCDASDAGLSTIEISRGTSLAPTVCVVVTAVDGVELGGALPVSWTASGDDPASVTLFVGEDSRCATLAATRLGSTSITVATAGLSSSFTATVVP